MQDPLNPNIAIGRIVMTDSAANLRNTDPAEYLPIKGAEGYFVRGSQRHAMGLYQQAIEDFNQVLNLTPDNGDAQFMKGLVYQKLAKKEAAISAFEAAAILFESQNCPRSTAARRWIRRIKSST